MLRATRPRGLPQHDIEAVLFVAAADAPDRGRVALQRAGHCLHTLAGRDAEQNPGMLDLEPRSRPAASKRLEDGDVIGTEC